MNLENAPTNPTPAPMPTPPVPPLPPAPGIGMAPNFPATDVQPVPQPADPIPQPQAPQQPEPQPQPQQPQPAPQDPNQPQPQQNPQPSPTTDPTKQQQTYDEYLESLVKNVEKPQDLPNPKDVPENDPEALSKFFEEFGRVTEQRARAAMQQEHIIQQAEGRAWREVFDKYPEIQKNPTLRDTIHNIRLGAYQRGESLSPIQVADGLVGTLSEQYRKGINDTNVQIRVQDSQPLNGGGQPQPTQGVNYEALQQPGVAGQEAAIAEIDKLIRANRI